MKQFLLGLVLGLSVSLSGMAFGQFIFPDNPEQPNFYFEFGQNEMDVDQRAMEDFHRTQDWLNDRPCP